MKVVLVEPVDESVTAPLQAFEWSVDSGTDGGAGETRVVWDDLTREAIGDRSMPRPVRFSWRAVPEAPDGVRYDLLVTPQTPRARTRGLLDLPTPEADLWHLHLGVRYTWQVVAKVRGQVVATSPSRSFTTHTAPPRWIWAPGITNVRDLGGWPVRGGGRVRQGMVYRGSEMNGHVLIEEEGRHTLLEELGVRTDLDLRGEAEQPRPALDEDRVRWVNIPVEPYSAIAREHLLGREAYRQVVGLLADPAVYPLLMHCWGGADRAGTVAFLLGALLGMSREHLIQDYEATSLSIWGIRSHTSPEFGELLQALDQSGRGSSDHQQQVEDYLTASGVTREELDAIRGHLVEHEPTALG